MNKKKENLFNNSYNSYLKLCLENDNPLTRINKFIDDKGIVYGTTKNEDYEPLVSVSTSKEKETIVIKVKDNDNGIPENIRGKIFQPFFTTKPTGSGTG